MYRYNVVCGERPIGAAKGKQTKTMASCPPPPPCGGVTVTTLDIRRGVQRGGAGHLGHPPPARLSMSRSVHAASLTLRQANLVDCVLMDVVMPEVTGYDLVRQLRAAGVQTPIVSMSGCAEYRDECLRAGAQGFLVKPLTSATIKKALQDCGLYLLHLQGM